MGKKKKWWEKRFSQKIESKSLEDQFPNSTKQHKQRRLFDEDGVEVTDEYEYYDDYYQYNDWGRTLSQKETGTNYSNAQKDYGSAYKDYEKTGHWQGYSYYKAPQLSYKYVQQMANALAAQHRITLVIGNSWEVDLVNKKLRYNPASLIYGTKSELLATLLHEIGKLRYMEHYTKLQSKYLAMYKNTAAEAFNPFEDVRVDFQILRAYESAGELYESALPGIQKQVQEYYKYGKTFRQISRDLITNAYREIVNVAVADPEEQKIKLLQTFGTYDIQKVEQRINDMCKRYQDNGSLYEYCGDMLHVMYDLETPNSGFKNIKEKIDLTSGAIEPIKKEITSQGAVNIMESNVFPHLEDLMKDVNDKEEELKEMFEGMAPEIAQELARQFKNTMQQFTGKQAENGSSSPMPNANNQGTEQIRGGSSPTDTRIPPEWKTGEYKPLKDSVDAEIKQLVNKLTFLRREEMVQKFQNDQKRGKLNSRKLVKHAFGSKRLFKQKLPNVDTVQSFAFSVLMDISGSMSGSRIVHTTRAMVMFNEVFKKLNIPFELVVFGDDASHIKRFDQESDKDMEKSMGGLVDANGGGTNLKYGLEKLQIHKQPEKNKVVIVLSDGGVGNPTRFDTEYFTPWREKKGIKSLAFGIETSYEEIKNLCEGNGKSIENASQLPIEFAELLKSLIKKK